MTVQTGSVWLGYTEQTLAATWWLDIAYICSSHQRHQGPAACITALSSRLSVLHLSPSLSPFFPHFSCLFTMTAQCLLLICRQTYSSNNTFTTFCAARAAVKWKTVWFRSEFDRGTKKKVSFVLLCHNQVSESHLVFFKKSKKCQQEERNDFL